MIKFKITIKQCISFGYINPLQDVEFVSIFRLSIRDNIKSRYKLIVFGSLDGAGSRINCGNYNKHLKTLPKHWILGVI